MPIAWGDLRLGGHDCLWSITATESDDGGARFEITDVAFDAW